MCRDRRNAIRQTHPDFPGIEASDLIAPLLHIQLELWKTQYLGHAINIQTTITSISILTAATPNAVEYLNSRIKKIVILGWGEGTLGDTEQVNYGTAGIKEGESSYIGENSGANNSENVEDGMEKSLELLELGVVVFCLNVVFNCKSVESIPSLTISTSMNFQEHFLIIEPHG